MRIIAENNPEALNLACKSLSNGDLIAFATDTIYGIACDASNPTAVQKLYDLKKRDLKKPIAIFLRNLAIAEEIFIFDELSRKIAEKFLPGSLTLVLQKKPQNTLNLADNLNNQSNSLGFRIVDHKFTKDLMSSFTGVLAVSSANLSNQEPALTAQEVKNHFPNSNLTLIIDGNSKKDNKVSTVLEIINKEIKILRHGAISENSIKIALD